MYKVKFDTGETVSFQNQPTDADIEEVVKKLGIKPKTAIAPDTQPLQKKDLLQKATGVVTSIFPGGKVGEAIGTLGGYGLTAAKEKLGLAPKGATETYDLTSPSLTQVLGDVGAGALTVAGMKGVGTSGTFTQQILKSAGLGAALSGTTAISEGANASDIAKSTAIGGAIGGALPVAGAGLRAIGRQIEALPARFVNSALSRSKAEVLKDIAKDKVDDFAKYVVKNKPIGSASKLLNESIDNVGKLDASIDAKLASAIRKSGGNKTIGISNLLDEISKTPEAEGALLKRADVKGIIERLAPQTKKLLSKNTLNLEDANKLRQLADRTLGDKAFLGSQLTSDKSILKNFADTLRELVKSKAPEETRALFGELTNEIRFRNGLLNRIAQKQGNQVLSFGDFIGGGLGGIFGGGIPGAVAGVATRRAIESVPFKLSAAKLTNAATKLEPIINQLAPAQRTAILNFFADIFSGENQQEGRPQ